jgi:peptidoglycan/xylan/chitin deacetylase (PgdA/CDA1 family)
MSMRHLLAHALHAASLWSGDGLRRAKAQRAPRILMYHGIGDGEVSAELFDWQLRLLRDEFEPVSLPELLARREAGRLSGDEVVITFDDGVRNHVSTAYPLLCAHRVPATFFVCPGLIDSGRWIWNTEMRCRLQLLSAGERAQMAVEIGSPAADTEALVAYAKRLDLQSRQRAEEQVRGHTRQFSPTEQQLDRFAPASWDQLASLDPALVTIGSHTVNHPILPTLSTGELQTEIGDSRRAIEQRLQRTVDLFCYPNGDNDARAQATVREHYRAAVTTVPGAIGESDEACLLPRIPAGETRGLFVRRLHRHAA